MSFFFYSFEIIKHYALKINRLHCLFIEIIKEPSCLDNRQISVWCISFWIFIEGLNYWQAKNSSDRENESFSKKYYKLLNKTNFKYHFLNIVVIWKSKVLILFLGRDISNEVRVFRVMFLPNTINKNHCSTRAKRLMCSNVNNDIAVFKVWGFPKSTTIQIFWELNLFFSNKRINSVDINDCNIPKNSFLSEVIFKDEIHKNWWKLLKI